MPTRALRAGLKGLQLMRFEIAGRDEILRAVALNTYLVSANIRFGRVEDAEAELRANLAHFSAHTFAHVVLPAGVVDWPRDQRSGKRVAMVVVEGAELRVRSEDPVVAREPGLFLIPPGTRPVQFEATAESEVSYISFDVGMLPGIELTRVPGTETGPITAAQVAPLTSFIKSLCAITAGADAGAVQSLATVGQEITRSLAAMIVGAPAGTPGPFHLAIRMILHDFTRSDLSIRMVADELHVSVRTLQAAFAQAGTTFSRELRAVRLKAVDELRTRDTRMSLAEASVMAGFGSLSAYYRAIKPAD